MEPASSAQACKDIRRHLAAGAPWDACDTFNQAKASAGQGAAADAELLFCGALAHARAAATDVAQALLDQAMAAVGEASSKLLTDILSLRGRLWKDRCQTARSPQGRAEFARQALQAYGHAFALNDDTFPGINAATLHMVLGQVPEAQALAATLLERLKDQPKPLDMWHHATVGEAWLLLGHSAQAQAHYTQAFAMAGQDAGSVSSMRRQLQLLAPAWPAAAALLLKLPSPCVWLLDDAAWTPTALSPTDESAWQDHCLGLLKAHGQSVVYAPATCGAALVFIEAALSLHIEVTVLLPFDRQEFVDTCVAPGGAEWRVRFEAAMAKVTRVVWATEEAFLGDDVLFQQGASMLEGLARLRSDQLETTVSRVAMPQAAMALPRPQAAANPSRASRTIKALLFGDVAGFSRLNDAHAPLFHARFLQVVAEELDACAVRPLETNTWGDALYVVFDTPAQAADFALRLMQRMLQVDWAAVGLTPLSQVRIGLHAGPVYCGFDPIIERDNYFGSSVTKTARIEPVTPPGMVYVSEAFAAQLAARSPGEFTLEYMGELSLAKGYGTSRIYRLARPQH